MHFLIYLLEWISKSLFLPYNNGIIIINEKYINYNNCVTQMNALLLSLMEVREVRIKSDNITHVAIIILVVDLKR